MQECKAEIPGLLPLQVCARDIPLICDIIERIKRRCVVGGGVCDVGVHKHANDITLQLHRTYVANLVNIDPDVFCKRTGPLHSPHIDFKAGATAAPLKVRQRIARERVIREFVVASVVHDVVAFLVSTRIGAKEPVPPVATVSGLTRMTPDGPIVRPCLRQVTHRRVIHDIVEDPVKLSVAIHIFAVIENPVSVDIFIDPARVAVVVEVSFLRFPSPVVISAGRHIGPSSAIPVADDVNCVAVVQNDFRRHPVDILETVQDAAANGPFHSCFHQRPASEIPEVRKRTPDKITGMNAGAVQWMGKRLRRELMRRPTTQNEKDEPSN